jgi:hypothetical protein
LTLRRRATLGIGFDDPDHLVMVAQFPQRGHFAGCMRVSGTDLAHLDLLGLSSCLDVCRAGKKASGHRESSRLTSCGQKWIVVA